MENVQVFIGKENRIGFRKTSVTLQEMEAKDAAY